MQMCYRQTRTWFRSEDHPLDMLEVDDHEGGVNAEKGEHLLMLEGGVAGAEAEVLGRI